ncbi:unnamed protein product [Didymodactylos carnosus]|uniref:Uncharacterized protein n=1 Tax=Didymodactylos carnosus TaxID=1234261 RepID=A0A813TJW3_9BILA|nr:unnamed protein product [Didymodactylos carnosus]CAF0810164.1 unnamed protein product [Didymodactylos carnosus]CAF3532248.1 unnamed protein product [Didymodactylos carnosus]CAF3595770.1 unnamed protein product [Didymodactylos carnosus]
MSVVPTLTLFNESSNFKLSIHFPHDYWSPGSLQKTLHSVEHIYDHKIRYMMQNDAKLFSHDRFKNLPSSIGQAIKKSDTPQLCILIKSVSQSKPSPQLKQQKQEEITS